MINPYVPYPQAAVWPSAVPVQPGVYPDPAAYAAYTAMPTYAVAPTAYAPLTAPVAPAPVAPAAESTVLGISSSSLMKGVLVGAVAAYVLTNENVQQSVIKTAVKAWALMQGGVEEMKERFRDAEAELHAADTEE